MRYGETGYNLEINLTRGDIERVAANPRDSQFYLDGLSTNAKIMWDRVPPEIEAFSPDNLLIFATGLLCGTPAIGCNRIIVTTISPQTQLLPFSMMGGFWALKLKYAGYHKVIEECTFCRSPCPSRDDFKEPDSSLPLKCDICEGEDEP